MTRNPLLTAGRARGNVLVTGGAGYIGSHVVRSLVDSHKNVTVFDNLSTGHAWAVKGADLVVGDLGDGEALDRLFADRRFDAVMHFAANIWVGESITDPIKYYRNNVAASLNLFQRIARHGVPNVVFSSTAAVYGEPGLDILDESLPSRPINPYGASKMMAERMLSDIAAASRVTFAILRYFNVAGAEPGGRIGEATPNNSHLVKIACETALGLRPNMRINGIDYPTPDGTCIRDYIHVEDLASAHVSALDYLQSGGASTILNCGYGRGQSVREVIDMVRDVTATDFAVDEGPRRPGDPPKLVADNTRIRQVLEWRPRHDDLRHIVETAWRWEQILHRNTA